MDLTEYSRHLGRSKSTVHYWTKPGGILESATEKKDGKIHINVELADRLLEKYLNTSNSRHQRLPWDNKRNERSLNNALIEDKYYAASLKKIKLKKESGALVPKVAEERAGFECGRQLRDSILSIRERLSAILAAESDEFKVYQILTKELNQALELTIEKLGQKEEVKNNVKKINA